MRVYDSLLVTVAKSVAFVRDRLIGTKRPLTFSRWANIGRAQDRKVPRTVCIVLIVSLLAAAAPSAPSTISNWTQQWQTSVSAWTRSSSLSATLFRSVSGSYGRYQNWLKDLAAERRPKTENDAVSPASIEHSTSVGSSPVIANHAMAPPPPPDVAPSFSEDPLEVGVTVVKATHITQLQEAIDAARTRAGLPAADWVEVTTGMPIKATDIQELRIKLDQARAALGLQPAIYSLPAPTIDGPIRAAHVQEIRNHLKSMYAINATESAIARLDPANETGGGGENPLSRNYNWSVPLVGLPGRSGLDLGLSLSYNSLVWTKHGSTSISFDDDRGFPSAGFRLGFPVIQPLHYNSETQKYAHVLITPDGGHTELRQVGSSTLYEAADSSHLLYDETTQVVRTTDGTQLSYALKGSDYQCTEIKDRNGNFITITYTAFDRISTVVDTLGRIITFNYDPANSLTSITQLWNGQTHYWATFEYYGAAEIETNFPGLTVLGSPQNNETIKVLSKVTLNNDSRFEFDYTSWGQIWKIRNHAAGNGHLLNYRSYNLLLDQSTQQTDCPRFTERRDWAQNWNRSGSDGPAGLPTGAEQEVLTASWIVPESASWNLPDGTPQTGTLAKVTAVDGTYNKIYFEGAAGTGSGWRRGLASMVETWGSTTPGATVIKQRSTVTKWTQDNNSSYPLNPRVEETNTYDFDGGGNIQNRARTTIDYQTITVGDGTSCKLPNDVVEFQANATTPLRRTHNEYNSASTYTSRRILGLVSEKKLYQIDPTTLAETLMSQVGFIYDEAGSIDANAAPEHHDNTNYTASFVSGRANLSRVKRFDVTNTSFYTTSTMTYNTAGSTVVTTAPVLTTAPSGDATTFSYVDNFSDGINHNTFAYPTSVTNAGGFSTTAKYNFDFGAVTRTQSPAPAGQTVGAIKHLTYDSIGRLEKSAIEFNGNTDYSHTRFAYVPNENRVDTYVTIKEGTGEARSFSISDGHGRVFATASDHPGSEYGYGAQMVLFNNVGRAIKSSNPTETNAGGSMTATPLQWQALGDDATPGWKFTHQTYDWKGRPLVTTNTDGTTKEASYTGCGCAGGAVVTLSDEGTVDDGVPKRRSQKIYSDILGRTVKTEVLNWQGGTVYSTAISAYNALDQVTSARQYQGLESSGVYQETTMAYDGYGRLKTKHIPEQKADATITGSTDHTTWEYNPDDTVQSVTDARGIATAFVYNSRRLLIAINYPAVGNLPAGIPVTSNVDYEYDNAGNRTLMSDDAGNIVNYNYNSLSQLTSEARQFAGLSGTYTLAYQYTLAGQVKSVADQSPGTNTSFSYTPDIVGRVSSVDSTGLGATAPLVSNAKYRASGALKHSEYGNGTAMNLTYNARGLISQYSLSGVKETSGAPRAEGSDYQYYADGQVKFASDFYGRTSSSMSFHDKSYQHDHVGRLQVALSGVEANDFLNGTNSGPFHGAAPYLQTSSHDAWDNLVSRTGFYWSEADAIGQTYDAHNRNFAWTYDADGRLISMNEPPFNEYTFVPALHTYDAAGRHVKQTQTTSRETLLPGNPVHTTITTKDAVYDGDGQQVKSLETRQINSQQPASDHGYYVRSSVLGGRVITEYDAQGLRYKSHVYGGGSLIASTSSGGLVWRYNNPVTGDGRVTDSQGKLVEASYVDPDGMDVGETDPASAPSDPGPPTMPMAGAYGSLFPGGGGLWGTSCIVDGIEMGCGLANVAMSIGAAGQCPDNNCNPRMTKYGKLLPLYLTDEGFGFWYRRPGGPRPRLTNASQTWSLEDNSAEPNSSSNEGRPHRRLTLEGVNFLSTSNLGSEPDVCELLARNAQDIYDSLTNKAINRGRELEAVGAKLSKWYVGKSMSSLVTAGAYYLGLLARGGDIAAMGAQLANTKYFGTSGFPTKFLDSRLPDQDQTHHFVAFLSAGINDATVDLHASWDFLQGNGGDLRLGYAAYHLGQYLRANRDELKNIGDLIRDNICRGRSRWTFPVSH